MKFTGIIMIIMLLLLVGAVSATETMLAKEGTVEIIKLSNVTGETVIRDTLTDTDVSIASTSRSVKANSFSDYFKVSLSSAKAVFHSWATNLVPGTDVSTANVYLKDIDTGDISMIKPHARFPVISDDGKYMAYEYAGNYDTDLPSIYLYEIATGKETFVAYSSGGNAYGWSTQELKIQNGAVWYNTTYPYPGVNGFTQRYYAIPVTKPATEVKV